ncbi:MAG: glycosyltransferase family 2 protein [Sphingobacteriaceae bacterium]|nr:MAG: glycosyltransferase family 2 protein [Sphingobacteriaceae bacterium]
MEKVCVLIRVYNRIEDLGYCINIIRDTWKLNNYYILLVSNGEDNGFIVPEWILDQCDEHISLNKNIGHFNGNSQLLLAGLKSIPADCSYTVILEADTWLYKDSIINTYTNKLKEKNAVWASAQFYRYITNAATDFAIIKTSFVKSHPEVFTFVGTPEYYIGEYLTKNKFKFIYIKENMPVNLPKYIRKYPYAPTGRFFVFPRAKMVTHHVENLVGGMDEKKLHFNVISGTDYFDLEKKVVKKAIRIKMKFWIMLSAIIPYKSWFVKTAKFYK